MMLESLPILAPLLNKARDIKYHLTAPKDGWAHYARLSGDPAILYTTFNRDLRPLFSRLRNRRSYFLINFWHDFRDFDGFARFCADHRRRFPEHSVYALCNTEEQVVELRRRDVRAEFVNQNAFVDEDVFKPDLSIAKKYDAVYDAQLAPFKRHELALRIESLALIAYVHSGLTTPEYVRKIRTVLAHARWLNYEENTWRGLDHREVCAVLNESRVGLCLSESEGAMYASVQYLLCGLPVVSTPSRGGRDVFFNPAFVKIVHPDAHAIAAAVHALASANLDPQFIRQQTLDRMKEHRKRFIDLVQGIYDAEGNGRKFAEEWRSLFFNKLLRFQKLDADGDLAIQKPVSQWA